MARPRIGYTTKNHHVDFLRWMIAFSIFLTGGRPVRLYPASPKFETHLDGLVVGGGTDVYPPIYKVDPKENYDYDHARDEMEIKWLEVAQQRDIPILGICRGVQIINVQRGGTLHMDVSKAYEAAQYPSGFWACVFFRKVMNIKAGSLLAPVFQRERIEVNSMHTQAIDDLGQGLEVVAYEDNGVVQAVEDPSQKFLLGVQFHPEAMIYKKPFRDIFRMFVDAARA